MPLAKKKQKIYDVSYNESITCRCVKIDHLQIRIEAYDLGVPTPLSSDLDLTVYVSNINDYQPQFMIDEFVANFTGNFIRSNRKSISRLLSENDYPGKESIKLPDTIDRDELEFDGPPAPICYYVVGGNQRNFFKLIPTTHQLTVPLTFNILRYSQGNYVSFF